MLCLACVLAAGCSMSRWIPFGSDEGRVVVPENAQRYQCGGNRSFYLRQLGDKAVWLILADREIRLDRRDGARAYGNGISTLVFDGDTAEFNDGPGGTYADCKPA